MMKLRKELAKKKKKKKNAYETFAGEKRTYEVQEDKEDRETEQSRVASRRCVAPDDA
jgi:hypothetical protein